MAYSWVGMGSINNNDVTSFAAPGQAISTETQAQAPAWSTSYTHTDIAMLAQHLGTFLLCEPQSFELCAVLLPANTQCKVPRTTAPSPSQRLEFAPPLPLRLKLCWAQWFYTYLKLIHKWQSLSSTSGLHANSVEELLCTYIYIRIIGDVSKRHPRPLRGQTKPSL